MLSSLSRIFQPGPVPNPDRADSTQASRETESKAAGPNENSLRLILGSQHSDSTPLLYRHHASHLSLHSTDSPRAGPSHVSWKTPNPGSQRQSVQESPVSSSQTQPMWGTQAMNRTASASSPSLLTSPLSTASASQTYRPSSVGKRSSLSMGFTADSANASEDSDGDSVRSTRSQNVPKPLSPIHELRHFPPQRRVSMESVPRTPDSTRTFDRLGGPTPSPVHSAFLNRPLKRSTSQTSNSTFRSNISTAAPAIPPLDLRPDFQNALGVPHGPNSPGLLAPPPRKSRLPSPTLPTVIGSPVQTSKNKVSVIYEDGASARTSTSFITAPSLNLPSPDTETPPPIFIARDYANSNGTDGTETEETGATATQRPRRPLPEGLYEDVDLHDGAEFGLRPPASRGSTPGRSSLLLDTPRRSSSTRPSYSRSRSASPASSSESFLHRRWLKGMSFGSDRFVLPPSAQARRARLFANASHACILFWLGFVAPWCWLIGGWLLTRKGEVGSDGLYAETGPVLPLWHKRRSKPGREKGDKSKDSGPEDVGIPVPEKVRAINGAAERRIKAKSWYPLIAPSLESLTPSTGSGASTRRLKRCLPTPHGVDPWIQRCRIAAAASGVLIFAAFVVAIVLVAGVRM
ncbi:hypothetical protein C8Q77DRAFT_1217478 [Trametes polyzona]|nr:hypothetical protein C8Q77DRAFT_1217478 [Trametes polyzona]